MAQSIEDKLMETYWRHAFTLHVETNSITQQASEAWRYYLYFRYDSICEHSLNDKKHLSSWATTDDERLTFPFRHSGDFEVIRINDISLDLKCLSQNGKDTLLYHFTNVSADKTPFGKNAKLLPVATVQAVPAEQHPVNLVKKGSAETIMPTHYNPDDMLVELVGGGYYGGINPVVRDYITINYKGRLIHEFESVHGKRQVFKDEVDEEQLQKLVAWVEEQHFFEMEQLYDCKTPECEKRKSVSPRPVPLRLCIAKDGVRKMVTVSIWGLDKNGRRYVSYPPELDHIIDAIQRMANRSSG